MKLQIEISLDGLAFAKGGTDEAIRCIAHALEELRGRWAERGVKSEYIWDCYDNKVGTAKVSE